MTAQALLAAPSRREHAPREEYLAWVKDVFAGTPKSVESRRYFYDRFLKHWPDLEDWFAEPLLVRLDLHDRIVHEPGKRQGPSHEAGPYLVYLSLVHGMPLDAGFVLSRNFDSLFNPRVAAGLGVDMALFERHIERTVNLGYRPVTGRSSLTWTISRLLLWRGDPDITAITHGDIMAFGEEISRYCALPAAGFIRASHVSNARRREPLDKLAAQHEKACRTRMFVLHVLLFDIGQVSQEPRHGSPGT